MSAKRNNAASATKAPSAPADIVNDTVSSVPLTEDSLQLAEVSEKKDTQQNNPTSPAESSAKQSVKPNNIEGVKETAKAKGFDVVYVASNGDFHWNEELAKACFKDYSIIKISDL